MDRDTSLTGKRLRDKVLSCSTVKQDVSFHACSLFCEEHLQRLAKFSSEAATTEWYAEEPAIVASISFAAGAKYRICKGMVKRSKARLPSDIRRRIILPLGID